MSVTGRFLVMLFIEPGQIVDRSAEYSSSSTRHASGRSSAMSMNSPPNIFLTIFWGTAGIPGVAAREIYSIGSGSPDTVPERSRVCETSPVSLLSNVGMDGRVRGSGVTPSLPVYECKVASLHGKCIALGYFVCVCVCVCVRVR